MEDLQDAGHTFFFKDVFLKLNNAFPLSLYNERIALC